MTMDLYQASVPVFLRYLARLRGLLDVAEAQAQSRSLDVDQLLNARLSDDMLPFAWQVIIATHFTLRACFALADQPIPADAQFPHHFDGLRSGIARATELLQSLNPSQFVGAEDRILRSQAGHAVVALPGADFLLLYALPNFFFHLTTAYALLRHQGISLGKADFDGFHVYR